MEDRPETEKLWGTTRAFMIELDLIPGWVEWRRARIDYTISYDDEFANELRAETALEFIFPAEIERRHRVVHEFLILQQSVSALADMEYYFRRYPFHGMPVSHRAHLAYMCEMYFSRFYEIRSRLKNLLNSVNQLVGRKVMDVGQFLKIYDSLFDRELRQRNHVHHHDSFDDVSLSRLFLAESLALRVPETKERRRNRISEYQRIARTWAQRAKRRAETMSSIVEAAAKGINLHCKLTNTSAT